jgi:replicative DNA helicase
MNDFPNSPQIAQKQFDRLLSATVQFPDTHKVEECIVSVCLNTESELPLIIEALKPDCFTNESLKTVYTTISEMSAQGMPVDILTVTYELRRRELLKGEINAYFITQLSDAATYSLRHVKTWISILVESYTFRTLYVSLMATVKDVSESGNIFKAIKDLQGELARLDYSIRKTTTHDSNQLERLVIDDMVNLAKNGAAGAGIQNRHPNLSNIVGVWQNSDLIIFAARPGMGKTSFVQNVLTDTAAAKKIAVFFSLEMPAVQIMYRILSGFTVDAERYSAKELRGSALDPTGYVSECIIPTLQHKYNERFKDLLYIDDTPQVGVDYVRETVKNIQKNNLHPLGSIVIDYLQLMSDNGANGRDSKTDRLGYITSTLKGLAKEFNVPIILLSQLSREVEKRADKTPQLSDLRGSGDIEQDADVVVFQMRPEYYQPEGFWLHCETGEQISVKGYGEFTVAKHRSGMLGKAAYKFIDKCTSIIGETAPF